MKRRQIIAGVCAVAMILSNTGTAMPGAFNPAVVTAAKNEEIVLEDVNPGGIDTLGDTASEITVEEPVVQAAAETEGDEVLPEVPAGKTARAEDDTTVTDTKSYWIASTPLPHADMQATANSWYAGNESTADGEAGWAINGNADNWWHSNWGDVVAGTNEDGRASAENPIIFTLKLDKTSNASHKIKKIILTPRTDSTALNAQSCSVKDFKIQFANVDNPTDENYFDVYTTTGSESSFNPKTIELDRAYDTKYVRLYVTAANGSYVTLSNIDVYEVVETDRKVIPYGDMTATANSWQPNNDTAGPPSNAIDGNQNTIWHSNWSGTYTSDNINGLASSNNPISITVKLQNKKTICEYVYASRIQGGDAYNKIKNYTLSVSTDGTNYDEIKSGAFDKGNQEEAVRFEPVEAQYIKLTATSANGTNNSYITARDIRVYEYTPIAGLNREELKGLLNEYKKIENNNGQYTAATFKGFQDVIQYVEENIYLNPASQNTEAYAEGVRRLQEAHDRLGKVSISAQVITGNSHAGTVSVSSENVSVGGDVTFTARPVSAAYPFVGWYDNADGNGTPVSIDNEYTIQSVNEDTTLYAKFDTFEKTYHPNTLVGNGMDISENLEAIKGMKETTLSFDFKLDSTYKNLAGDIALFSVTNPTPNNSVTLFYRPSDGRIGIHNTVSGYHFSSHAHIDDENWHTITVKLAANSKFVMDGGNANPNNAAASEVIYDFSSQEWIQNGTEAWIGKSANTNTVPFKGEIKNVVIKALADDSLHSATIGSERTDLATLIQECNNQNTAGYTDDTVSAFNTALQTARGVAETAARSAVYNAYDALAVAKAELISKKVESIVVSGNTTMEKGSTQILRKEIKPAVVLNKKVTWTSSDSKIATVDETGTVTAKAAGVVIITATAIDGSNMKDELSITVTEKAKVSVKNEGTGTVNVKNLEDVVKLDLYAKWNPSASTQATKITLNANNISVKRADTDENAENTNEATISKMIDGNTQYTSYTSTSPEASEAMEKGWTSCYFQIDLGDKYLLNNVKMWRYYTDGRAYKDTIIVASEDEQFDRTDHVLFSTVTDSQYAYDILSNEKLATPDADYVETSAGKAFDANNVKARYIRIYMRGNELVPGSGIRRGGSHICELEVYGKVAPKVEKYTVAYQAQGETVNSTIEGEEWTFQNEPAIAGFTFDNWYTDEECKNTYTTSDPFTSSEALSVNLGDQVTLQATETEGNKFQYWKVEGTTKPVSTAAEYTVNVDSDVTYVAVFAEAAAQTQMVTYHDVNGKIYKVLSVEKTATQFDGISDQLSNPGFVFKGWDKTNDEILAAIQAGNDVDVNPVFEEVKQFILTVNHGGGSGTFEAQSRVTIVADAPGEGQKFSHWENENGKAVSYATQFTFYLFADTVVSAVYVSDTTVVEKKPDVFVDAITKLTEDGKLSFTVKRYLPAEYQVVSHGIILTSDASIGEDENAFVIGATNTVKGTSKTTGNIGTYVANKKATEGQKWYGRGYMIYKDASGKVYTLYSNISSETM